MALINGVASGDVTQTSIVLWTRSTTLGNVTFEYSTDANFGAIAGSTTATVTDDTLPVKVEISGLTPGTQYYYRITDESSATATGTFQTAASLGTRTGLNFGVTGDWRGELAPYPAIGNVASQNLDFFVQHGDTIYADYASPGLVDGSNNEIEQATTLANYRAKHAEVYGERYGENFWADVRSSTAIFATIDDHEVINDFAGGATADTDNRFPETTGLINDTQLYENGLQAFQEYNPLRDEFYGATGDNRTADERKLYRYNTFGSDAATFVLDTRSFRDVPLDAPNLTDLDSILQFVGASLTLDRQFLGEPQLADLKQDLLNAQQSGITWKFVLVPEPIQELGLFNVDAFEGYANERNEILKFIEDNDIQNVVFVAADIHGTFVNNLTYQETLGETRIATSVWEITTGSVAFDEPFGQTAVQVAQGLGLLTPQDVAFYESLPVAPDADSLPNDKDDFLVQALTEQSLTPLGYDPIGLNNNLPQAEGLIDAILLQGDYVAAHTFGWTQFDIDPVTQALTVTTYGIDPYSRADLEGAEQATVLARIPQIVSQFVVSPQGFSAPPSFTSPNTFSIAENTTAVGTVVATDPDSTGLTYGLTGNGVDNTLFAIAPSTGALTFATAPDFEAPADAGGDNTYNVQVQVSDGLNVITQDIAITVTDVEEGTTTPTTPTTPAPPPTGEIIGTDQKDVLTGTASNDVMRGLGGNDRISSNDGDDILFGDAGNDRLNGGDGDDILIGGDGVDRMTGGDGIDIFIVRPGRGFARIRDFDLKTDKIGFVKGEVPLGAIEVQAFRGSNTILLFNGRIIAGLEGISPDQLRRGNVALVEGDSLG